MAACLSVRMEKLSSHWTDFYETCLLSIFRKSIEKIAGLLKSEKNGKTQLPLD
jgi:hypothetical protein